jgi:D-sedoheptulose 7-phosphate isomerase
MDFKSFATNYINNLHQLLLTIDLEEYEAFITLLKNSTSRIYIIGNGGSASTASHMANDLGIGLKRRDKIALDTVSLSDNISVFSALANDIGYENVFYMQLKHVIKPEDTLIAISCSGNSPNIIKAVDYAKEVGCTIVGLSGFDGGKLKNLSDINLHIETDKNAYGLVEDIHMIINHIIYSYFQKD